MSQEKLHSVHEALTQWCLDALAAKDPESGRSLLTAAEATVIRGFLKDNDITASPEADGKLNELREKLKARRASMPLDPALDGLGDGLMQ
jgi:hypothetical protein